MSLNFIAFEQRQEIRSALDEIEDQTCIKFIRRPRKNFIRVFSGRGCFSAVGMAGGVQGMSLQSNGCIKRGIIMHEFLHALGFYHMQSSHNRDNYIRIKTENIKPSQIHNFYKYSNRHISHFGTSYDLDSIMHYSKKAFSRNGRDTIETIDPEFRNRIGQRGTLSSGDIHRINNMYKCWWWRKTSKLLKLCLKQPFRCKAKIHKNWVLDEIFVFSVELLGESELLLNQLFT